MFRRVFFFVMWLLVVLGLYRALVVLPPSDVLGEGYRIFFFHIPVVVLAFFSFSVSLIAGVLYLYNRSVLWDAVGVSAVRLGFLFGALALVTGWGFTFISWGTWWSWDPKVVATFVMWFVYMGYLMLRRSADVASRARLCAIYSIIGYASVPIAYLSSKMVYSLHPESIGLTADMKVAALLMITGFFLMYAYLLRFNVRLESLLKQLEV